MNARERAHGLLSLITRLETCASCHPNAGEWTQATCDRLTAFIEQADAREDELNGQVRALMAANDGAASAFLHYRDQRDAALRLAREAVGLLRRCMGHFVRCPTHSSFLSDDVGFFLDNRDDVKALGEP